MMEKPINNAPFDRVRVGRVHSNSSVDEELRCIQNASFHLAFCLHLNFKISKTNDMENERIRHHVGREWMPNPDGWNLHSILSWNVRVRHSTGGWIFRGPYSKLDNRINFEAIELNE